MKPEHGEQNSHNNQPEKLAEANGNDERAEEVKVVLTTTNPLVKIGRWIQGWLFSYESTYLPLVFLWFLGVIWAVFEMIRALPRIIKPEEAGVLTPFFIVLIAIQLGLGFMHQFVVFRCIHVFDSHRQLWVQRFPNWIGTKSEWILRALILLSLLAVGGEIPLLAKHLRDSYHHHLHEIPIYTFPACSVALYSLLICWDIWGALRAPEPAKRLLKIRNLVWPIFPLELRQVYFFSDILCLIFWFAILWAAKDARIGPFSFFLVLLTAIFFTLMTIYRIFSHIKSQGN